MPDVYLKYVGRKEWTIDSITKSGVSWNGYGDIQPVPEASAERLLKHPDQWALVSVREALAAEQAKPVESVAIPTIEPFDDGLETAPLEPVVLLESEGAPLEEGLADAKPVAPEAPVPTAPKPKAKAKK